MSGQPQRRMKYEAVFKKTVVQAAKDSSNSAAARQYCISEKLVRDWRKAEKLSKKCPQPNVRIVVKIKKNSQD